MSLAITSDKEYQSRWDAETLAEAKSIEKDPTRLQKAQDAARVLANEQDDKVKSMKAVAARKRSDLSPNRNVNRDDQGLKNFNVFQKI